MLGDAKALPRGRSDQPSQLLGPDQLTGDMRPADLVYVLDSLTRFPATIEVDRSSARYLRDC